MWWLLCRAAIKGTKKWVYYFCLHNRYLMIPYTYSWIKIDRLEFRGGKIWDSGSPNGPIFAWTSVRRIRSVHASSIITFRPFLILWRGTKEQQSCFGDTHCRSRYNNQCADVLHKIPYKQAGIQQNALSNTKAVKKIKVHLKQFINL